MSFSLASVKRLRKQLNLTQQELARHAGLSQSMIAKIEAGTLDPTYSSVQKLEEAFATLSKHHEQQAKAFMHKEIIFVQPDESLRDAVKLLTRHSISQLPVAERGELVGLLSEADALHALAEGGADRAVSLVMGESPPVVDAHARISVVLSLLNFYPLVVVRTNGKMAGVITKTDVLRLYVR